MKARYFSTFQLILLALFAALIVVAKIALRLPIQLSGHSGIFWMAIMLVGTGIVAKPGAASLIGLTSGILAAFLGMGDFGALNTFLSYTAVGVSTELAQLLMPDLERMGTAVIVGALGHMGKFLVKWLLGVLTGAPIGFIALGMFWAMLGYIIFGGLGGLLGRLTLKALHQAGFFAYIADKR
ncbi:MAG: hypothetical protein KC419_01335 [Anaerolineales bacterium]|nr:hypothetical protein [Anaerolineales bacterium]